MTNTPENHSPNSPPEAENLSSARDDLAILSSKLEAEKQARNPKPLKQDNSKAMGMRIASDFIAGIVFGVVSGYYLDKWLNSHPWGLMGMTVLGFAAGIRNAMRTSAEFDKKQQDNHSDS